MQTSQLYLGDKLGLFKALKESCEAPESSVSVLELSQKTGYNVRWVREWCAGMASTGVLQLLPGTATSDSDLKFRLPSSFQAVLADPSSQHYSISLVQSIPALMQRAKDSLPTCFKTGVGIPYNDPDVTEAIDRAHAIQIREVLIPIILPKAGVIEMLENGCTVADLGCGGGDLLMALARAFPKCKFAGYEVSDPALEMANGKLQKAKDVTNVEFVDARVTPLGKEEAKYDVVVTFDVLHDAPFPSLLIDMVKKALKPNGTWVLADIYSQDDIRKNIAQPSAGMMYGFSVSLCMSCALSEEGGEGLGTLGFTVPIAKKMMAKAGFHCEVLEERPLENTRWFKIKHQ
eukprot:m.347326 g.347326  ORF g.347326 m.347326 type:complete len:346 (-) comp32387_c0_seq1:53-1090(-)